MPRQDIPHENVVLPMPGRSGAEHARPLLTASENRLHRLANFRAERANFHPYPPATKPKDPSLHGAEDFYRRAIGGMAEKLGWEHPSTLSALLDLARAQLQQGRPSEAAHAAESAHNGLSTRLGPCARATVDAAETWAVALEQLVSMHLKDDVAAGAAAAVLGATSTLASAPLQLSPSSEDADMSLSLPPPCQVHGDAALSRSRSSLSRNNASSSSSSSSSSNNGNISSRDDRSRSNSNSSDDEATSRNSETLSTSSATEGVHKTRRASEAVSLRRRIAAARAEEYGGEHASTMEAALALAKSLELHALCLDRLDEQVHHQQQLMQQQQQSEKHFATSGGSSALGIFSGHDRAIPSNISSRHTDTLLSPTFSQPSALDSWSAECPTDHYSGAATAASTDSCRTEAAQLRAAVAHTKATLAAAAPLPRSAYVPAYATGQPSGKGAPPVPMGYGGIPGGIGGHLGNIS